MVFPVEGTHAQPHLPKLRGKGLLFSELRKRRRPLAELLAQDLPGVSERLLRGAAAAAAVHFGQGAILDSMRIVAARSAQRASVSAQHWTQDSAVRALEDVSGVQGYGFLVIPAEDAHLQFRLQQS